MANDMNILDEDKTISKATQNGDTDKGNHILN
jgi:hypothetical protein